MKTTEDRLSDWVARGESETQEFKASTGQRGLGAKAACAMLNHKGGRVIFGVDARGRIVGQDVTDKTVDDVAAYLRMIETWGRGTIKMAEMMDRAGLPRPEIEEIAGAVIVRFRATLYQPPTRIGHDLTDRQRELLDVLASAGALRLAEMLPLLKPGATARSLREDLYLLRRLKLVELKGRARGARWHLKRAG